MLFLFSLFVGLVSAGCFTPSSQYCDADFQINPDNVTLFATTLTAPPPVHVPVRVVDGSPWYEVWAVEHMQQILPDEFPQTPMFAYAGLVKDLDGTESWQATSPGPSFHAQQFQKTYVVWANNISCPHIFPVDPLLHWANPNKVPRPTGFPTTWPASTEEQEAIQPPRYPWFGAVQEDVPISVHLHGAEVAANSDGNPDHWYTASGLHGPAYAPVQPAPTLNSTVSEYPNGDLPSNLWYHDHALGITRLNVVAGMSGMYMMSNPSDPIAPLLPSGKYDWPLVFQDRIFNQDGSICFPIRNFRVGQTVTAPYWTPTYLGNVMVVNGKAWPSINVDRGQYMFRLLDGCNTRYLNITIEDESGALVPFSQIQSDGGYLQRRVELQSIFITPAQRHQILVDFSSFAPGTKLTVRNNANAPYAGGGVPTDKMSYLLQFVVGEDAGFSPNTLPDPLMPSLVPFPSLEADSPARYLALSNVRQGGGRVEILLMNGQVYVDAPQLFENGKTYDIGWVNLLNGNHPMHIHLASVQVIGRRPLDAARYEADWIALNGGESPPWPTTKELDPTPYYTGPMVPIGPSETGWMDVVDAWGKHVTIVRIAIEPIAELGTPFDDFDVYQSAGYVLHCHLLEHEDNEMMIRFQVRSQGCSAVYANGCNRTLATPCCVPGQTCLRHASSGCGEAPSENYRCIPDATEDVVMHHS